MNDIATPPAPSTVDQTVNITQGNFEDFLRTWDADYKEKISNIELFNTALTTTLSYHKKSYFVKAFYHIRGHFHDFLWYMGNHAPDLQTKKIILNNIGEEFGGSYGSHEQLYYDFAEALGVDIKKEIADEATYEDYIVEFNKGHLKWLREHGWLECLSAFSAYEHLDNIDYSALSSLANSLGVSKKGMLFFRVHEKVQHFQPLIASLREAWQNTPEKVIKGFHFIGSHQITMWQNLSKKVFSD